MNVDQLRSLFPNASRSTIEINAHRGPSGTELEPTLQRRAHGSTAGEKKNSGRCVVRVTAFRARSCDPDNLCAKYFVDALRYAGVIHDDREEDIIYQISQKKVETKNQEKTLIEIEL